MSVIFIVILFYDFHVISDMSVVVHIMLYDKS